MSETVELGDRILATARDQLSSNSGSQFDGTGRPHISPLEKKRLTNYLRKYHLALAEKGICYQFLEIFLSGMMFYDEKQRKTVVEDNALFASSVIHFSKDGAFLKHPDEKTMKKFWRKHPSNITVSDIESRIRAIRNQYSAFLYGTPGLPH